MMCPDYDELFQYREHELGERRAGEVRRHLAGCPACTDQLAALAHLVADLRAPISPATLAEPYAVARVMRRLDAPVRPARRVWPQLCLAMAAAAIAVVAATWPARDPGTFTARGGAGGVATDHVTAEAIARGVGTTLFAVGARIEPLAAGARVSPSTAFVLGYRDLSRAVPLFALVFAVDARREVHWLYPAFTTAADDPPAVALSPSDTTRLMAETVVLDRVPPGPLRVIVVVSAECLRVSTIERLRGDELAATALQRRFPAAAISEQTLEVSP
jgi:hypothetical protein